MNKLFKYNLLRHLPGERGRRYQRKLVRLHARTTGFEEAIRRSAGMMCIDLGANVGEYTRKMAPRAKQVIAFEPDPWTHAALRTNVADLENVKIENAAAGTHEGDGSSLSTCQVPGRPHPSIRNRALSLLGKSNVTEEGAIEVRQIDFIRYLEDLDEDIGILKIDIEGAEVDLLEILFDRPKILERIHYIFAETHETRIPGHEPRVEALREKAQRMERPRINLHWH